MTVEEWVQLPSWVRTSILGAGYYSEQIGDVRFDLEAKPRPTIEVMLHPRLPTDVEFTIVVDQGG